MTDEQQTQEIQESVDLAELERRVSELEALRDGVFTALEKAKQNPMIRTMLCNFGIEL